MSARGSRTWIGLVALAGLVCAVAGSGCQSLYVPAIDPSGRRIFADTPTSISPGFGGAIAGPTPRPAPVVAGPPPVAVAPRPAPVPADSGPLYHDGPGPESLWRGAELLLYPCESVAPVGTEVVLLAGVRGPDQYLVTNEKIEWSIAPGGVGHFVDLGWGTPLDWLVLDFLRPKLIDATRAVGKTGQKYLRLTRGNNNPCDDVAVVPGQTWITVTSPKEGTSYVTAFSPDVRNWDVHKQTAVIHWIDVQFQFPPPAIGSAGSSHALTTSVSRQSNGAALAGWLVRYEIAGGPAAGFAPDGAQAVEVPTDASGRAGVEIIQPQPTAGTNRVNIQVIRPGGIDGGNGRRLVVGSGATAMTWSSADLAVRKIGPSVAAVGATVTYRIEVSNPGDLPAEGVTLTDTIPQGMTYLRSSPEGQAVAGSVRWQLGSIRPGETRAVEVHYRADRGGPIEACAEATTPSGLRARGCATTEVGTSDVTVQTSGPQQATVGDEIEFEIDVTNRGRATSGPLLLKDRFDAGLRHAQAPSPIEKDLGSLAPGQTQRIGVKFRVVSPGRLCHTVEVLGGDQVLASASACVSAVQPAQPQPAPPSTQPSEPEPGPPSEPAAPRPSVSLRVTGPASRMVGETAEFTIVVRNTGMEAVTGLRVVSASDADFKLSMATRGHVREGDDLVWVLDSLPAGDEKAFVIQADCLRPGAGACNRVRVEDASGVLARDEACVEIRRAPMLAPANLSVTVFDRLDPARVGDEFTYEIQVFNNGQLADSQIAVTATLSPQLAPVRLQTTGPAQYEITGQTVRFAPVARLEAGQSLSYRIRVRAKEAGNVKLVAELTSQQVQQPLVAEEETEIEVE